jgi:hypothetical protein
MPKRPVIESLFYRRLLPEEMLFVMRDPNPLIQGNIAQAKRAVGDRAVEHYGITRQRIRHDLGGDLEIEVRLDVARQDPTSAAFYKADPAWESPKLLVRLARRLALWISLWADAHQ